MRTIIFTAILVLGALQVRAQCGTSACDGDVNLTSNPLLVDNVTGTVRRYRIYQSSPSPTNQSITINTTDSVALFLDGINVNSMNPINIADARVYLNFYGVNKLVGSTSGIRLDNASITITSTRVSGDSLIVRSGPGCAGIGTAKNGSARNITILQGAVVAEGGRDAAGIGGSETDMSNSSTINSINISGGYVRAQGGPRGAGIGTGSTYGDSYFGNPGYPATEINSITISGGVVSAVGGSKGAGIGTGEAASAGGESYNTIKQISITGGSVIAPGNDDGAGIGTGYGNSYYQTGSVVNNVDSIFISGGYVRAQGMRYSSGIGTGNSNYTPTSNSVSMIKITGGVVDAQATQPYYVGIGKGGNGVVQKIIISGGNVKVNRIQGSNAADPTNSAGTRVFQSIRHDAPKITELIVDGVPYNITGNFVDGSPFPMAFDASYSPDAMLYVYLPHANDADSIRQLQWRNTDDGETVERTNSCRATWRAANSGFFCAGTIVRPTSATRLIVTASPGFTTQYGSDAMHVSVITRYETSAAAITTPANRDEVVILIDGIIVSRHALQHDEAPNENTTSNLPVFDRSLVDLNRFGAGQHTMRVEWGGTDVYMSARYETILTITRATLPAPTPVQGLTAPYGTELSSVALPSGLWWKHPDSTVGAVGTHQHTAYYALDGDTNNYNKIETQQSVRVTKATPNCTEVERSMKDVTGTYGGYLSSISLPDGWMWVNPTERMTSLGVYEYSVLADTAKFLPQQCMLKVMVLVSTAAPPGTAKQYNLLARPNPIFTGQQLTLTLPTNEDIRTISVYGVTGALVRTYNIDNDLEHISDKEIVLPVDFLHGLYIIKAGRATASIVVL